MSTQENQNTEWKQSWRDEYLKWVCGFANAEGGTLVIGKNDSVRWLALIKRRLLGSFEMSAMEHGWLGSLEV